MGLVSIGALVVTVRRPNFSWTSTPTGHGIRSASIAGVMQWAQAQSMSEMVANQTLRSTVAGQVGVRETLVFDDVLLGPFTGDYLLQSFDLLGDWQWAGHGIDYPVAFSMKAAYIGNLA
jgi:hypothetical protein